MKNITLRTTSGESNWLQQKAISVWISYSIDPEWYVINTARQ